MKVVIAPDSFKGSASAGQVTAAVREGVLRVFPSAEIVELPLADGGEGTLDCLIKATNGKWFAETVTGPTGKPVQACYGVLGDGKTVVVEAAQASGLTLVPEEERDPMTATSFGTGELILRALEEGYRSFLVGLGGTAVNDGGAGMMKALGLRLRDADGRDLPEGGAVLARLASLDDAHLAPGLREAHFTILNDVTNPLCGPTGASAVFGPQKGATLEMVKELDQSLQRWAEVLKNHTGRAVRDVPGAGAAGGMGAAFLAFTQAVMVPGIEAIMRIVQFDRHIRGADLIITGEGKLDEQTLSGKVIAGVCRAARSQDIPVVALCGQAELSGREMDELGLAAAFSLVPGPFNRETAMNRTLEWLADRAEQVMRFIRLARA